MSATISIAVENENRPHPFIRDLRNEGWKLRFDQPLIGTSIVLVIKEFFEDGDPELLPGNIILKRARKLGVPAGQKHSELLLERQHLIPELGDVTTLAFVGTAWYRFVHLITPVLVRNSDRWHQGFPSLKGGFDRQTRLVLVEYRTSHIR